MREHPRSLDDFPLHDGDPGELFSARETRGAIGVAPLRERVAPLSARCTAAAADSAAILLVAALAILGARMATGLSPRLSGVAWVLGFLVPLSLFATVPALILFGKTVGMALVELSAIPQAPGVRVSPSGAFRRWLGTLGTVAAVGLPLLWTARDPQAPTPADRLSGHPLALE
jgi:RDD family protein